MRRVFANGSVVTVAGIRSAAGYAGMCENYAWHVSCGLRMAHRFLSAGDGLSPTSARLFTPSSAITDGASLWISEVSFL